MANETFDVAAYLTDDAVPALHNKFGYVMSLNREFANWQQAMSAGTRGIKVNIKLPTRLTAQNDLTFDATTAGDFSERRLEISADQQRRVNYAITDVESATFDKAGLLRTNPKSAITEIATAMDSFAASKVAFQGYRFFGDFNVSAGQNTTVAEVTDNMALFKGFGCGNMSYYGMPLQNAASVIQSGLQQFVTKRNEEISIAGEIGKLGGVSETVFFQSNLLPTHTAGTASLNAANFSTGYTIDSISWTPPSNSVTGNQAGLTTINLSGMNPGDTIVENDAIDIGFLNTANPLRFLTFTGYIVSEQQVQGKVVTGGTVDGGGLLTIVIEPALIFDATNNDVNRNLNRDIIAGTDTLRVAKTHRCATIHNEDYGNFVSPKLPSTDPFKGASTIIPELKVGLRAYYGYIFGNSTMQFVHDAVFGYGGASEGFGRVLLAP